MTGAKAIATTYNGVSFRSRLEARWAMFFDLVNADWRYEYEGYQLPSGWYVPDFWLPQIKTWVEIKPPFNVEYAAERDRKDKAERLCGELAVATGNRAVLMSTDFGSWLPDWNEVVDQCTAFMPREGHYDTDAPYLPCICPECYRLGFEFEGRGARICKDGTSDRGHTASHHIIQKAVDLTLAHRFI
jgi:hypothetical protein